MAEILGFPYGRDRPGDVYDPMPSECNPNEAEETVHRNPSMREQTLDKAKTLICDERAAQYGRDLNLKDTANLWSWWLDGRTMLNAADVCMLQVLGKISRARNGQYNSDNAPDIAGYIALYDEFING